MRHRSRLIAAGATVGLALMTAQLAPAAQAARPVEKLAPTPVVKVSMSHDSLTLSTASVRAGLIMFKATTAKGQHILQLLRLHTGYTPQQLQSDIALAFQGDTDAIGRVDDNVSWLSGASATPKKPGWIEEKLKAGHYFAIDQNGNGFGQFDVTGTVQKRTPVATHGGIRVYTYGFDAIPSTLPHSAWITTSNHADQPHFIELDRVKPGTTHRQVQKWIKAGAPGQPPFAMGGSTGLGVISPGFSGAWKLDAPKGKYLIACFWPDRMTGQPHFFMGMWDLLNLK